MGPSADAVAEARALAVTATPIVASYLLSYGCALVMLMLVGHVSVEALAAVALATMFQNASGVAIIMGTANACDTLCSQAFGAGNAARVGLVARRGVAIALATAVPVAMVWGLGARAFFTALGIERATADAAAAYLRVLIAGLPAFLFVEVLKKPLISVNLPGVAMALSLAPLAASVFFGVILVHGAGLGYLGAAWASVAASWFGAAAFCAFFRNHRAVGAATRAAAAALGGVSLAGGGGALLDDAAHATLDAVFPAAAASFAGVFDATGWREYLAIGVPSAAMLVAEWGSYEALAILAGRLGTAPLAAHSIFASTATLSFMPFLGLSVAACVRVGAALGGGRASAARLTLRVALAGSVALFTANAIVVVAVRGFWGEVFTGDEAVVDVVARGLPIIALYTVFDGTQCVLAGVLRGAALAAPAAAINVIAYLSGLALAAGLSEGAGWGLTGIWLAFVLAVFVAALLMFLVLQTRDWDGLAARASAAAASAAGDAAREDKGAAAPAAAAAAAEVEAPGGAIAAGAGAGAEAEAEAEAEAAAASPWDTRQPVAAPVVWA